jgi:hypothetical protein
MGNPWGPMMTPLLALLMLFSAISGKLDSQTCDRESNQKRLKKPLKTRVNHR